MNRILNDIRTIMINSIKENLPDVSTDDLEKDGAVFYMNGNNGTEYDWYVNEKISNLMIFYNDKDNLGAAKANVYDEGDILLYLYDDHGKHMAKEIKTCVDATKEQMRDLAVQLKNNADEKRIWDDDIENIDTDTPPSKRETEEFIDNFKYYENSIKLKMMMNKLAVVSKKILEDGFKVGYMKCEEPHDEEDSGWVFYAGDETDEYIDDMSNFALCYVNYLMNIDPSISGYLHNPQGTFLVKTSAGKFEPDKGQESYLEKWKD